MCLVFCFRCECLSVLTFTILGDYAPYKRVSRSAHGALYGPSPCLPTHKGEQARSRGPGRRQKLSQTGKQLARAHGHTKKNRAGRATSRHVTQGLASANPSGPRADPIPPESGSWGSGMPVRYLRKRHPRGKMQRNAQRKYFQVLKVVFWVCGHGLTR
jgi:hypothetical protein